MYGKRFSIKNVLHIPATFGMTVWSSLYRKVLIDKKVKLDCLFLLKYAGKGFTYEKYSLIL